MDEATVQRAGGGESEFARRRARLVDELEVDGITDRRVLAAMSDVERHDFVPEALVDVAYDNRPLPIGEGQTISQPFVVAWMAEAADIRPGDRVLEVGTGSGYGAAVLRRLGARVVGIERYPSLAERARTALARSGAGDVDVRVGDGSVGVPDEAPFDAIVVTAAAPSVPAPLLAQLADGGRLVMPVGEPGIQELVRVRRCGSTTTTERLGGVAFVPLVGEAGWCP